MIPDDNDSLPVNASNAVSTKLNNKDTIHKESKENIENESIRVKVSVLNRLMALAGEMVLISYTIIRLMENLLNKLRIQKQMF